MKKNLLGGRDGIYGEEGVVNRPAGPWTPHIHLYLKYLHDEGFHQVPMPINIEGALEKVSYVQGAVYNGLLPNELKNDHTLSSVARLLRAYHDLGASYVKNLVGDETWMLPRCEPVETMCHGDFAPYNICMDEGLPTGIIDFDTLHPGPRMWDIAYALYRWVPFMSPDNPESFGSEDDKVRRLQGFMDTYGQVNQWSKSPYQWVIKRLEALTAYMREEAAAGNKDFVKNIEEGHLATYLKDIDYIKTLER